MRLTALELPVLEIGTTSTLAIMMSPQASSAGGAPPGPDAKHWHELDRDGVFRFNLKFGTRHGPSDR
jgi:hypothetical protein